MSQPEAAIPDSLIDDVFDIEFWRRTAPKFTITDDVTVKPFDVSKEDGAVFRERYLDEGYIHLHQPGLDSPLPDIAALFNTMIDDVGLPAVFSFVYDELWALTMQLDNVLKESLHEDYVLQPDIWAWRVEQGDEGWKPHRDMINRGGGIDDQRRPLSLTIWVPITDATPVNGCMYMVPAKWDQNYAIEGEARFAGRLPDVRALPAKAGDVLAWTTRVFHWGSRAADKHDMPPRMSVAYAFQRSDAPAYNDFWLDPHKAPDFETRLHIIAKQIIQYTHMYDFTDDLIAIAERIVERIPAPESFKP